MNDTLRRSLSRLPAQILNKLPLFLCVVDGQGRIKFINDHWRAFAGFDFDIVGAPWTQLFLIDAVPDGPIFNLQVEVSGNSASTLQGSCHGSSSDFPGAHILKPRMVLRTCQGVRALRLVTCEEIVESGNKSWILYAFDPSKNESKVSHDLVSQELLSQRHGTGTRSNKGTDLRRAFSITKSRAPSPCALDETQGKAQNLAPTAQPDGQPLTREASGNVMLAGLDTQLMFNAKLTELLTTDGKRRNSIGVLLLNVDHFADLIELCGEAAGDHVLETLVARIESIKGEETLFARFGGDTFALGVTDNPTQEALDNLGRKILSSSDALIAFKTMSLACSLSVGSALFPRDADTAFGLERCAATALAQVKKHGRGGYRSYHPSMSQFEGGVTRQTNFVRCLLNENLIYPAYQSKHRLSDGAIIGAEALMRWKDTSTKVSGPDLLPEIFRNYDLASRVSVAMQERVFTDIVSWRQRGISFPFISINAAPVEFVQDDYAEKLLRRLSDFKIDAPTIEVELTEHILFEDSAPYIQRALSLLSAHGVKIVLDDFGSGYSGLGFLKDSTLHALKIDRSFIKRICTNTSVSAIVEAIIEFGRAYSADVVAEGIETREQLALLQQMGCPSGQGFLFSKPQNARCFERFLRQNTVLSA